MQKIKKNLKISFQKLKSITPLTPKKSYDFSVKDIHRIIARKPNSKSGIYTSNCDHPDIQEFITSKQQGGKLTKFNISVLITDKFIEAVKNDTLFDLQFNGKVYKTVKAVELYDLIMKSTYNRAEPGVLFYDNMQKNNPISYLGPVTATNPCGEIPGNTETTTVCLLGSINLTQYVRPDRTFDEKQFVKDIKIFTRMLDNINDLHNDDLPAYLWAVKNVRQFGMGLNGFGSMLYMMGIEYGSYESILFAEKLNRLKLEITLSTSATLAIQKGKAKAFSKEYFNTQYWNEFLKDKISPSIKKKVEKYGLRNLKLTTNPPLGNTSVLCDNVSNGLEPVFMHSYQRTYITEDWPEGFDETKLKSTLEKDTKGGMNIWEGKINGERYYYEPYNRGLCKIETVYDYGYNWVKENYPEDLGSKYLITTQQLDANAHIDIQVAFQKYIDQSVSKTVNIPKNYPFEDFKKLYLNGHSKGLLGMTTYREGSMEAVLSEIDDKKSKGKNRIDGIIKTVKLPNRFINGPCEVINREGQKFYIHFSYLEDDPKKEFPIAMWIQSNQKPKGEAKYANRALKSLESLLRDFKVPEKEVIKLSEKYKDDPPFNKLAKSISMCLRHNLPIKRIVRALENLEGDNISTLLTAVRKFLSTHIKDGELVIGGKCEACGSTDIIYESGCLKCRSCGASNCG